MKSEMNAASAEASQVSLSDLPRVVFYSPAFPMAEWGDFIRQSGYSLRCVHSLSEIPPVQDALSVVLFDEELADEKALRRLEETFREGVPIALVSIVSSDNGAGILGESSELTAGILPMAPTETVLQYGLATAFQQAHNRRSRYREEVQHKTISDNLERLNQIGVALSAEKNIHKLLDLILTESRALTNADAGSIYLVEQPREGEKNLRFKHTQNDSKDVPFQEFVMPASTASIAGYVAVTGETLNISDVYRIPPGVEYSFNQSFDQSAGYRSKSMLVVPMTDHDNKTTGVLQLINAKRSPDIQLHDPASAEKEVIPFDAGLQRIIQSLASQAAVALDNALLLENIESTFEGFVKASVHAIEQRDPTTSGHSERVTQLTLELARAVNDTREGRYARVTFSEKQIKELRYAGLLHDFGKIGVQEQVLLKENKLYPVELETILHRFEVIRNSWQRQYHEMMLERALENDREGIANLCDELRLKMEETNRNLQLILRSNIPSILPDDDFNELKKLGNLTFHDSDGEEKPYLTPGEIAALSLQRGNLTDRELKEIQSHASLSYNFLVQIPWTRDLSGIPEIAHEHHEKLNGKGYPRGLLDDEIVLQAKMMCVCDIFDALTAADRAYKKAAPLERAIQILKLEVADGHLCPELVDIFIRQKVYRAVEAFRDADYSDTDS